MSNSDAHSSEIIIRVPENAAMESETTKLPTHSYDRIDDPVHEDERITQHTEVREMGIQGGAMSSSHHVAVLEKQLSDAMAAAAARERKLHELEARLLQKDSELEALKDRLSTHNDSSDADVADHLDRVNDLVEQFAVSTAVRLTDAKYKPSGQRMETAYEASSKNVLGSSLVQALQDATPDFEFSSLLLQFAFQSVVLHGMAAILSRFAFYIPGVPALHEVRVSPSALDNVYYKNLGNEILKNELQSSFGHWRSMTHQYLRKSYGTDKLERRVRSFVGQRQKDCYQYSLILFKDAPPSLESFYKETWAPIKEIVDETLRLAIVIRENVITRNYEAHLPRYKEPFSDGSMEAEEGDGDRSRQDRVVCVTALGLSYSSKSGREGDLGQMVFKKAKVLTEDVLNDFSPSNSKSSTKNSGGPWLKKLGFR